MAALFNFLLLSVLSLFQYSDGDAAAAAGVGIVMIIIYLALIIVMVASYWKLFTMAGKPGWAAIVPIYNIIVILEIVGRPMWWILILFVCAPVFAIVINIDLAKSYGKETGFGVGLILLPIVFLPMLAFSSSTEYVGPAAAEGQ
jgi:hypothetical protein